MSGFVLIGLLACIVLRHDLLPPLAWFLDVGSDPDVAADVVMALPGDPDRRPFVGAALVNVGLARHVLIPKNAESPDVYDGVIPPTHEVSRRIYVVRGVAEERITILDGDTVSTIDDVRLLVEHLETDGLKTAYLVTSAFHTRRTRWVLQNMFPSHASQVFIVSAPNPGFDADVWWHTEKGFVLVLSEYVKLAAYWIRYGNGVAWFCALLFLGLVTTTVYHRLRRRLAQIPA